MPDTAPARSGAPPAPAVTVAVPVVAALAASAAEAAWLTPDGELEELSREDAARRAATARPLVCHAPATAARLGVERFPAFDLLELFAFVRPAQFCLPTVRGLANVLGLPRPRSLADEAAVLPQAAQALLAELARLDGREHPRAQALATTLAGAGWAWGDAAVAALGGPRERTGTLGGLAVWERLTDWTDYAPQPAPDQAPVEANEARERLKRLLGSGAEARPAQSDYAALAARAFAPRDHAGAPNLVLAEAGTGIGKTLGYIAPASLWAEKNGGAVWLSTFTKNLQRQIDQELNRLYPQPAQKAAKVVVRKGRENYLCLLNLEEAAQGGAARPQDRIALALLARWAEASRDGDMIGGDFPAWLTELMGRARTLALTDQRGECIYSACPHYRKCFIERSIRRARRAEIVIANHALVMVQAAHAGDSRELPTRYVFDEGHHVFDAADGTFAAHLSGAETADLRRWLRGPEGGRRSRARGLKRRIGDLAEGDDAATTALEATVHAAAALPGEGWLPRIAGDQPAGPTEAFLARVRQQVYARAGKAEDAYGIECKPDDPVPGLPETAAALRRALAELLTPMQALIRALTTRLDKEADALETAIRVRIEAAVRGLERRAQTLAAWQAMLADLGAATPPAFVDWFAVDREAGRDSDVGFYRHWLDPTVPFAEAVLKPAHGVLVTSATLRDRAGESDDWRSAEVRTGALHLPLPATRASLPSPFDYAGRTRILVVTDVRRDDPAQVAAAYRELMLAAGGGGLGLFTAIWRLRAVHKRIAPALAAAGLPLLAQHVDPIDTATLVDIFRADEDSCLLGTDAVRDGVDVPGRSLRLIVFDRVPWPRPDLLHKARRAAFGGQAYDDMITRLRLKQAYGRLLRRADDIGVFVMLDAMLPSRLLTAFPPEAEVRRIGLAEAVAETRAFLA